MADLKRLAADLLSYVYRQAWAIASGAGSAGTFTAQSQACLPVVNHHGLLLRCHHKQPGVAVVTTGRVAIAASDTRWCSDGFEILGENGDKLRVTFAMDCLDRGVMNWVPSAAGYRSDNVQSVMLDSIEKHVGLEQPAAGIERLSDNGSAFTAEATRVFARGLDLKPLTTPECSPQSYGMVESLVKTMK